MKAQQDEINEHFVYRRLARSAKEPSNRNLLKRMAEEELGHYDFWKKHTGQEIRPQKWVPWKYGLISKVMGITFGMKWMENKEAKAHMNYETLASVIPEVANLRRDEIEHEKELINLVDEERLRYIGSMVLGLSDALVELTGVLAGLTFTLRNTRLIALAGFITGIAAALSMAGSEYLSTKSEESSREPLKASVYTGIVYIVAVFFLVFPYVVFESYSICLGFTLMNAVVMILLFTFYISVAKGIPFRRRFFEMVSICFGVALLTFIIGYFVRLFLNVEV